MHRNDKGAHTDGMVIHWAGLYDLLLKVMTLGREARFRRRMLTAAGVRPGERVLDVGCGTGTLALLAAEAVGPDGRVHGIDPAAEMVERARSKAQRTGAAITFDVGVIEALDLPDHSVDVVFSTLVFHHLPSDELQRKGLAEIQRVLVPGGRLLIVDFGKADRLMAEARAAGFTDVTTARLGPNFLFSLLAATCVPGPP